MSVAVLQRIMASISKTKNWVLGGPTAFSMGLAEVRIAKPRRVVDLAHGRENTPGKRGKRGRVRRDARLTMVFEKLKHTSCTGLMS